MDDEAEARLELVAGGRARLEGLAGRADLNGLEASVLNFVEDAGRWAVSVDASPTRKRELIRVKPQNLVAIEAPPAAEAQLSTFMQGRPAAADGGADDSESDSELLEAVAAARLERRAAESETSRDVAKLVARAEREAGKNQLMKAVELYTEALALEPTNVGLFSARGSACARLNLHKATLHDGEQIISILPDWHQGHALCGMALFCLRQYAPAVRAYTRALQYPSASGAARTGLEEALEHARGRLDEEVRKAALTEDVAELQRLCFGGGGTLPAAERTKSTEHSVVSLEAAEPTHGFTVLALASAMGKLKSIALLLEAGALPNARDKYGKTPIMWAAKMGNEGVVNLLEKGGADIKAQDATGFDALFVACHAGQLRLATVWALKCDVNRATADGTTCLMAAAEAGRKDVAAMLIKRKADPALANAKGQRALELAAGNKHADVVELLEPLTPPAPPRPKAGPSGKQMALAAVVALTAIVVVFG